MSLEHFPRAGPAALFALLLGLATLAVPSSAAAQAVTEQADARAILVRPFTFMRVQDLRFGGIIPGPTAGVVRVTPAGVRTGTGGVTLVGSGHQPAEFAGMGLYNQQVRIRMGSNTIQLTGPGTSMTVSQWEIGSTPTQFLTTGWRTFRLGSPTGMFTFPLGARVNVNANQAPGTYTGTFSITLEYN
jgi:hypothetical protein